MYFNLLIIRIVPKLEKQQKIPIKSESFNYGTSHHYNRGEEAYTVVVNFMHSGVILNISAGKQTHRNINHVHTAKWIG